MELVSTIVQHHCPQRHKHKQDLLTDSQGNGRIERSFRTDEEEFYQVEDLPTGLGGLE